MSSTPRTDIAEIIRDGTAIDRAIVSAHRRVIETHRQLGLPLIVWRDGKVAEIPAESVDLAPEPRRDGAAMRVAERPTLEEMRERLAQLIPVSTRESIVAAIRAERDSR